jgi:hypothetical protein
MPRSRRLQHCSVPLRSPPKRLQVWAFRVEAIAAGYALQAAPEPGRRIRLSPLQVLPAPADTTRRSSRIGREWLTPVVGHGYPGHLARPERDAPMSVRGQVEPVRAPLTRVGEHAH